MVLGADRPQISFDRLARLGSRQAGRRVITAVAGGVYLDLQVQPGARRPGVRGVHGDRLKIAVSEPPEDGKANEAVVAAVAGILEVKSGAVSLVSGGSSRHKRVFVEGTTIEGVHRRIQVATGAWDRG